MSGGPPSLVRFDPAVPAEDSEAKLKSAKLNDSKSIGSVGNGDILHTIIILHHGDMMPSDGVTQILCTKRRPTKVSSSASRYCESRSKTANRRATMPAQARPRGQPPYHPYDTHAAHAGMVNRILGRPSRYRLKRRTVPWSALLVYCQFHVPFGNTTAAFPSTLADTPPPCKVVFPSAPLLTHSWGPSA